MIFLRISSGFIEIIPFIESTAKVFEKGGQANFLQIEEKKYQAELIDRGIKNIKKLAVVSFVFLT